MATVKTERKLGKVDAIVRAHDSNPAHLIAILQEIQAEYRYLPEEILTYVATSLGISPATVYGVATFYAQFSLKPKGKYVLKVCNGTACHVRGAETLKRRIQERLGLNDKKDTTDDLRFTLETVSCVGACGMAPVMTINDTEVHGQLTPEALEIILDHLLATAQEQAAAEGE